MTLLIPKRCWTPFTLLALLIFTATALADVTLPKVLGSNMVLQRDLPVPVWGWAEAGEKVTVSFAGQTKTAKAGDDGKWMVKLDKLDAELEEAYDAEDEDKTEALEPRREGGDALRGGGRGRAWARSASRRRCNGWGCARSWHWQSVSPVHPVHVHAEFCQWRIPAHGQRSTARPSSIP